jgi:hypothetical protein
MHGAFDPHFQLRPGDAQPVGGPLFWDGNTMVPPYEPVEIIAIHTVTVTQGQMSAHDTIVRNPWTRPDNEHYDERHRAHWNAVLHLDPGVSFSPGAAEATADVTVTANGRPSDERWVHTIQFL